MTEAVEDEAGIPFYSNANTVPHASTTYEVILPTETIPFLA